MIRTNRRIRVPEEEFSTVSIEKLESQAKSVFQLRGLPEKELFFLPNDRRPYTGWLEI